MHGQSRQSSCRAHRRRMARCQLLLLLCAWAAARAALRCAQVERQNSPLFQLVRRCSRSAMAVVAQTNASSLKRCADFASARRGLALNFSPRGAPRTHSLTSSCLVLECPEFEGLTSLHRDEAYDYYSVYVDPLPHSNWSCVPGVGMFDVHSGAARANYSDAGDRCRDSFGDLAHVVSEARTTGLSALLTAVRKAFVNLDDRAQEGVFITAADEPLACFPYRAWAPGDPRDRSAGDDCVVLDSSRTWSVTSCSRRLPFICELYPGDCRTGTGGASGSGEACTEWQRLHGLQGSEADRCEGWELLATPAPTTPSPGPGGESGGQGEDEEEGEQSGGHGQDEEDEQSGGPGQEEEEEEGEQSGGPGQNEEGEQGGGPGQNEEGEQGGGQGQGEEGEQSGGPGQNEEGEQGGGQGQGEEREHNFGQGQNEEGEQSGGPGQNEEGEQGSGPGQNEEGEQGGGPGQNEEGEQGGGQRQGEGGRTDERWPGAERGRRAEWRLKTQANVT